MTEKKETFEMKLNKLEKISEELKNPETELNNAVKLYEEGMKIAKQLDKELNALERRIEIVTSSCDAKEIVTQESHFQNSLLKS